MRLLPLLAAVALVGVAAAPATAQNRPARAQLQRANVSPGSAIVLRSHAGETQRVQLRSNTVRQPGRLAARYKGLRVNRTRSLQTRRVGRATPALRVLRTQEGRFVRRNGSHFRVR